MKSLKPLWNRIQFEMESHGIMDPSIAVQKEMEKEGWSFKLHTDFTAAGMMSPVSYTHIIPIAPNGKSAFGYKSEETYKQYREARRTAAGKVYKFK